MKIPNLSDPDILNKENDENKYEILIKEMLRGAISSINLAIELLEREYELKIRGEIKNDNNPRES